MEKYYINQFKKNSGNIKKAIFATLLINFFLAAAKMTIGLLFKNMAVISDATNSSFDVVNTVILLIAAVVAKPFKDDKHNYGHEKIEQLLVLAFSVIMLATTVMFLYQGILGLITPEDTAPNLFLMIVTGICILTKGTMWICTARIAKKTKSASLKAQAGDHISDVLSSLSVMIGLVCSLFISSNLVESIAVIIVSIFIGKTAVQIALPAINQLIDRAIPESDAQILKDEILSTDGVLGIDKMQTRNIGGGVFVDIEIKVDKKLTVSQAHQIAKAVHDKLESQSKCAVKHCNVHVHPHE